MPRATLGQHSQSGSRRRKWPDTRNVPRQAGLLPYLGDVLGERCWWAPFPRLATERHARRQRCMVHRVRISFPPFPLAALFLFFYTHLYLSLLMDIHTYVCKRNVQCIEGADFPEAAQDYQGWVQPRPRLVCGARASWQSLERT
jgi:hypothetical protein